jgi:hypothetical protein
MTERTPLHDAIRAADSFEAMPPLPRVSPRTPALTDSNGSSAWTVVTSSAPGTVRGSWV